jgi:hypothetical protein
VSTLTQVNEIIYTCFIQKLTSIYYILGEKQEQAVDCPEDQDLLSEYEQQRLKRIEENNQTLLKLVCLHV